MEASLSIFKILKGGMFIMKKDLRETLPKNIDEAILALKEIIKICQLKSVISMI